MATKRSAATQIPPTKSLSRFRSRVHELELYLDTVDAGVELLGRLINSSGTQAESIREVLKSVDRHYKALNVPTSQRVALANSTKKKSVGFCVVSLHSHFSEYLKGILQEIYAKKPLLVVGKSSATLTYEQIVKLGSFEGLSAHMVDTIFKQLEGQRSTSKLLDKLLAGTGVTLDEEHLSNASLYIEARHLLVHRAGKIDAEFHRRFASQLGVPSKINGELQLNVGFARKAIRSVSALAESIDQQLVGFLATLP